MINVISMEAGTRLKLNSGMSAEVIENIGDGQWLSVRYLDGPDMEIVGVEELVHASDIVAIEKEDTE